MTFLSIWLFALAAKIILLPFLPITPDETYYFAWGRHLQLSYFDHPPFVSWIMFLAQPFWKTPFGARLPGVLLGHLGLLPWYYILKNLAFSKGARNFWLLAMILGPLTGVGSFIVTPDLPLMIFWALSIWSLQRAVYKPGLNRWLLLGLAFGLGMLSKYTMVLFLPAMLIWLFTEKKLSLLKRPEPWTGLLLSAIVFLPVIAWNFQNGFASFGFQMNHGFSNTGFHLKWMLEYLGGQVGLLNPIIFIMALIAALKYFRNQKLLVVFGFTPLIFFLFSSLKSHVEPNWPVCAYPALTALAIALAWEKKSMAKAWVVFSLLLSTAFFVAVISHALYPWLPLKKDKDHTEILHKWEKDVVALNNYRPLYARSYQLAAFYSYYRFPEDEVFKPAGIDRKDFYDFLPQKKNLSGSYIVLDTDDLMPQWFTQKYNRVLLQSLPSGLALYEIKGK